MTPEREGTAGMPLWRFAALALIAVAIAAAAFLLWQLRDTLMMAFGAIVVAVLLVALADLLRRYLPLPHRWAVVAAALLVLVIVAGFAWLMGAQVSSQFAELWQSLPLGLDELERRFGLDALLGSGGEAAGSGGAGLQGGAETATGAEVDVAGTADGLSRLWDWISAYGLTAFDILFGVIVVVIAGVFLAMQPGTYRRGAVKLFPVHQQARIDETMVYMGRALRFWLLGELIAMAIVGVLVGLGAWLLGLPAPFALAIFAALTEFVPIVGPFVGAAPGVLLALTQGGMTVLWTILLYVAIQQLESNMIAPLVQEKMVKLPPAVFLLAILAFGGLFGILGVIFAAPLAVVTYVAVQKLWVRDTLREDTPVTGERISR